MLLLIDNFDSFTYNLVQAFQMLGVEVQVVRGESTTASACFKLHPSHLVIGPGPGAPGDYPLSKELISSCPLEIPLLGVCLGHQALAEVYGGKIQRAKRAMHGKTSQIFHRGSVLFKGISQGFLATRYHSLIVDPLTIPESLEVTAETTEGEVMALSHKERPQFSLQFHPESILTQSGQNLLANFLDSSLYSH